MRLISVDLGDNTTMIDLGIGLQFLGEGKLEAGLTNADLNELCDLLRISGNSATPDLPSNFSTKGTGWVEYNQGEITLTDESGNTIEHIQDYLGLEFSLYRYLDQKGITCVGGGECCPEERNPAIPKKSVYDKLKTALAAGLIISAPVVLLSGCIPTDGASTDPLQELTEHIGNETPSKNYPPDKYAVLISGNTDERHKENIALAYQICLENGFKRNDIYILEGSGKETAYILEGSGKETAYILEGSGKETAYFPVDAPATKEAIEKVTDHLSEIVDNEDTLLIYATDHGSKTWIKETTNSGSWFTEVSELSLNGDDITELDFQKYLSKIEPGVGITIFDQCYGGGFAKRTGGGRYIGISASRADEDSHGNTFPQTFFYAWRQENADLNADGKISLLESFNYALNNDQHALRGDQEPQLFSDLDPSKVFL